MGRGDRKLKAKRAPDFAHGQVYPQPSAEAFLLTDATDFSSEYFSVPASLQPYVAAFYNYRCDQVDIRDMHPSNVSHLVLFLRGEGEMYFPSGIVDPIPRMGLFTPCSLAAFYRHSGPMYALGAALTPLGWASLTGLDAGEHGNRVYPAADHFGPESATLGQELHEACIAGTLDARDAVRRLGLFIEARLKRVNPRHARLIALVMEWLSERSDWKLEALHAMAGYSERQVQRLTQRYFGLPPKALLRKSRALRAAATFSDPRATEEQLRSVADHFYDQSHMIREIRLFAGRTPGRLRELRNAELSQRMGAGLQETAQN